MILTSPDSDPCGGRRCDECEIGGCPYAPDYDPEYAAMLYRTFSSFTSDDSLLEGME